MSETVADVARVIKHPVKTLIGKLAEAGYPGKSADDLVSEKEKRRLFEYLTGRSAADVSARKKIVSQIKPKGKAAGTISIEIRRKKTRPKKIVKAKLGGREKGEAAAEKLSPKSSEQALRQPLAAANKSEPSAAPEIEKKSPIKEKSLGKDDKPDQKTAKKTSKKTAESKGKGIGKSEKAMPPQKAAAKKQHQKRRQLHIADVPGGKRKTKKRFQHMPVIQPTRHEFEKPTKTVVREVEIPATLSVVKLAQRLAVKSTELIKQMMAINMTVTINQILDQDTAILIVEELGHKAKPVKTKIEDILLEEAASAGEAIARPPVVTVMGHVDHGKTSLLDCVRRSQLTRHEAGGITQHIGAYLVKVGANANHHGTICFLDTPGHAAFTAMRARGAQVTDIVVLVVAADDSVMPQTKEAVEHARSANVPIVVAINKIDKKGANAEKVKTDLSQLGIVSEDWGGNNVFVEVSAKTQQGIDQLLELILLQAEMMELKATKTGPASGVAIESRLDKGRGPVVNVLVMQGCLKRGDMVLVGCECGRARVMLDEHGQTMEEATSSTPVSLLGLSGTPSAGEKFLVVTDEKKARNTADFRRRRARDLKLAGEDVQPENVFSNMEEKESASINVLIKADAQGSAEALRDSIGKLSSDEAEVKIISCGVGAVSESDVRLAGASRASVFGFNVRADAKARLAAQMEKVPIAYYSVIYELIEEVEKMMEGAAEHVAKEQIIGVAVVKDVFRSSKLGAVAGCEVSEGIVKRSCPIRVLRDNVVVYEGRLESLRRFKNDVDQVVFGSECGIAVKNYNDVKAGDSIEVYEQAEAEKPL